MHHGGRRQPPREGQREWGHRCVVRGVLRFGGHPNARLLVSPTFNLVGSLLLARSFVSSRGAALGRCQPGGVSGNPRAPGAPRAPSLQPRVTVQASASTFVQSAVGRKTQTFERADLENRGVCPCLNTTRCPCQTWRKSNAQPFHRRSARRSECPLLDVRDANSKPREHPGEGADVHHHD
jgi:hypothetical protein